MPMKPTDPLKGKSRGTAAQVIAWGDTFGMKRRAFTVAYLNEGELLCNAEGYDFSIWASQAAHETGDPNRGLGFLSAIWEGKGVPAGLGVTDWADESIPFPNTVEGGKRAARAHFVHYMLYSEGPEAVEASSVAEYIPLDYRWNNAIRAGYAGRCRVLDDLSSRWATTRDYGRLICERSMAIWPKLPDAQAAPVEGGTMPGANVLLIAGHRNNGGGNPEEASLTDDLAMAYRDALRAEGHTVAWYQDGLDGDSDPDYANQGLDGVSMGALNWGKRQAGDNLVILDLHFESGGQAAGMFCIVPDKTGLITYAPVAQEPGDVLANMQHDLKLARLLNDRITKATGLTKRTGWIIEPGIMDEHQTGVGGQGYRLATFAYTSPLYTRAIRLVVEHGALDNAGDRAIIFKSGFFAKVGKAAAAAITEMFPTVTVPSTPEEPIEEEPEYPVPTDPKVNYPEGMDRELAGRWFGRVLSGSKVYEYTEGMPISSTWLAAGDYSPIVGYEKYGTREYWRFASGLVIWRPNASATVRVLGGVA